MARILVDANVLSEATKPEPNRAVVDWLRRNERLLAVDPVILGEIRFGILLLPMGRRRDMLESWFEQVVRRIECLAWDARTGGRWAQLLAQMRRAGTTMAIRDSLIAATALTHALTLATRNVHDFAPSGANLVNPFGTLTDLVEHGASESRFDRLRRLQDETLEAIRSRGGGLRAADNLPRDALHQRDALR